MGARPRRSRLLPSALAGLGFVLAACGGGDPGVAPAAPLRELGPALRPERHAIGDFVVSWEGERPETGRLRVVAAAEPERVLWSTPPGRAFVGAGRGREQVREAYGHFRVRDHLLERCGGQRVASLRRVGAALEVSGTLRCASGPLDWTLSFAPLPESGAQLRFALRLGRPEFDRVALVWSAERDERFYGFGEQFSHLDVTGRRVPILVQEQGIGRGRQPLTFLVDLVAGAGGDWASTYAVAPHYLTSRLRSVTLENGEFARFDLRAPGRVAVEVFANGMAGRILHGRSPLELLETYTEWAGRMRPLPDWIGRGAVVGLQGGTERVREAHRILRAAGVPVAAFWLQDWVGRRQTSFGSQLWWNWELDRDHYPGWEELVADLRRDGVRVLTYVNVFLVDAIEKPNARRNLFAEARDAGLLVRAPDGAPARVRNSDFDAALLDLTHPAARDWIKGVLREQLLGVGASGWMADFGEALPWDAVMSDGTRGPHWHNRYPELWARVNREAIEEAGLGEEIVFFTRSGFTHSPRFSTLFWLGDQLVSWDRHDGLASALTGLLSGGLSGFTLNHSDVGGYTTLRTPILTIRRSRELFQRWAELSAFEAVFRTHEGLIPQLNHQFDSDPRTLRHFARMATLYAALAPYRRQLVREAARRGLPLVRPLFLHFPDDPQAWTLPATQFLLGPELLVAPVLEPGQSAVTAYLPAGRWVHLWSGCPHGSLSAGSWASVRAPRGEPAVFWREGSPAGRGLRRELAERGLATPEPAAACPKPVLRGAAG